MPINQYFNYQPLQQADYSFHAPLEMMGKTLSYLQDKSDKNYAALGEVPSLLNVPVLEKDAQLRANIENKYRDRIKQLVDKTGGDYSGVQKDVLAIQNDLRKDLSFSGNLGALKSNYDEFGAYQKRLTDNKTLTNYQRSGAINTSLKNYQGAGEVDALTGKYNRFSGIDIDGFDVQKHLHDIRDLKPSSEEQIRTYKEGNDIIDRKSAVKGVSYKNAYEVAKADLFSNQAYQQHRRQMAAIGMAIDPRDEHAALDAFAEQRSFKEVSDDLKRTNTGDREFAERRRHNLMMEGYMKPEPVGQLTLEAGKGNGIPLEREINTTSKLEPIYDKDFIELSEGQAYLGYKPVSKGDETLDYNHSYVKTDQYGISGQALTMAGNQLMRGQKTALKMKEVKDKDGNKTQVPVPFSELNIDEKQAQLGAWNKDKSTQQSLVQFTKNNYGTIARQKNFTSSSVFTIGDTKKQDELGGLYEGQSGLITVSDTQGASQGTLQDQISAFSNTVGDGSKVKVTAIGPSPSANPSVTGKMSVRLTVQGKAGQPISKILFLDNQDPALQQTYKSAVAAFAPNQEQFVFQHNGKPVHYETSYTESLTSPDGSISSMFRVARPTSPSEIAENKRLGIDGTAFIDNEAALSLGSQVGVNHTIIGGNNRKGLIEVLENLPNGKSVKKTYRINSLTQLYPSLQEATPQLAPSKATKSTRYSQSQSSSYSEND
jgi:hypothetical protein